MHEKKIIMRESPEAASIQNVTGWVDSNGVFWGDDERMARYSGSTHHLCDDCGKVPVESNYTRCDACQQIMYQTKYDSLEAKEWDGESIVCSDYGDHYFFHGTQDLIEWLANKKLTVRTARIVHAYPVHAPKQDADDLFCDELAEGSDVPQAILDAIDALNEAIQYAPPLSWLPSEKRVTFNAYDEALAKAAGVL